MNHRARLEKLQAELSQGELDALLVTNLINVRYLTGFSGTNGQVLVHRSGATFFTDGRYRARASQLVRDVPIEIYPVALKDALPSHLERAGIDVVGVEAATMTLAERDLLATALSPRELVSVTDMVENLRRVKEPEEIEALQAAARITDETFAWVLDRLAPGAVERDVAIDLEMRMRQAGADQVSFEPIVGSGPLSAHIHHTPTTRQFEKGDLILLDFGCKVNGYCSDITRTVSLGPAADQTESLYETVLKAQAAGIAAIRSGARAADVDRAARSVIEDAGHGPDFAHGLGHGLGLDVHEAPRLKNVSEETLQAGDVVTVEPGIYIIDSGGIRIEDDVVVTEGGAQVLTRAPKDELIEL